MAHALGFTDRVALALSELVLTWDRRDGFISDSDVYDVADAWTTDAPYGPNEDSTDRLRDDYVALMDVLYELVEEYVAAVIAQRERKAS